MQRINRAIVVSQLSIRYWQALCKRGKCGVLVLRSPVSGLEPLLFPHIMATDTKAMADGVETAQFTDWANKPAYRKVGPTPAPGTPGTNPRTLSATNMTYFFYEEAPASLQPKYRRLKEHNEDRYWRRVDTNKHAWSDRLFHNHLIDAITSQLELNENESKYAEALYHTVDKQRLGIESEVTAICCSLISLRRISSTRDYYPSLREDKKDPAAREFERWFKTQFSLSTNRLVSIINKIDYQHPGATPLYIPSNTNGSVELTKPPIGGQSGELQ